jgi:two-component system NarL family sensor kinase
VGLRDAEGSLTIQNLMQRARAAAAGALHVDQAVDEQAAPKLGYVIPCRMGLDDGHRHLLDDVDQALAQVDVQQSRNIRSTMLWIAGIAIPARWRWPPAAWR